MDTISFFVPDTPTDPIVPTEVRERKTPSLFDANGGPIEPDMFPLVNHVMTHRTLAEAHVRHLKNAYIYNDVIFIYDDEWGFRPLESNWRPAVDRHARGPGFLRRAATAFCAGLYSRIPRGFFVGSAGSSNYGHWLVDDLPRAVLARDVTEPMPFIYTKFWPEIDAVKESSLRLLSPAQAHSGVDRLEMNLIDDLYFIDPISSHPILKSHFAISRMIKSVEINQNLNARKIFVTRRSGSRKITNFDALEPILVESGFTIISAEDYSFSDQASCFANADVVVGIMGAAMTNVIFCKRDAIVLYLSPSGWEEPFYWDLCDTVNVKYAAMYGETAPGSAEPYLSDFSIEPVAFLRVLRTISEPAWS